MATACVRTGAKSSCQKTCCDGFEEKMLEPAEAIRMGSEGMARGRGERH